MNFSAWVGLLATSFCLPAGAVLPAPPFSPTAKTTDDLSRTKLFEEPLVPVGQPSPEDNERLATALNLFVANGSLDACSDLQSYLAQNPGSPWRLSLLVNLGLVQRHVGRLGAALNTWESAWEMGKDLRDPVGFALANRALGELLEANAGLGRHERLESLVKEIHGRPLFGLVTEKLAAARESLVQMRNRPDRAYRCGPLALTQIKALADPRAFVDPDFDSMESTLKGTSLAMNMHRAKAVGLDVTMARRAPGAAVVVPALVHWKTGHFSTLLAELDGRYLIQDPGLGDVWMTRKALDEEASGYVLVKAGSLPDGWNTVNEQEGREIWGRGSWGPGQPDDTRLDSHMTPPLDAFASKVHLGLGTHRLHTNLASLHVQVPLVDYTSAKGQHVEFSLIYNQREYGQPQIFDYCNLGPKWTFSFLACLKDDTTNPFGDISVCHSGGGGLIFRSRGDGSFAPDNATRAVLERTSAASYEIHYPDGRRESYTLADRSWGLRRIVLTRVLNPKGQQIQLHWDAQLRLVGIEDAEGRKTILAYDQQKDPLKLTRVVDPNGRISRLEYDAAGLLAGVKVPDGKASQFSYGPTVACPEAPLDFMNRLRMPGRDLSFSMGETMTGLNFIRWIEVRRGGIKVERLESGSEYGPVFKQEPVPVVPEIDPGMQASRFGYRNSFYWTANALRNDNLDYSQATNYQWGHGPGGFASGNLITEKAPGMARRFFVHAGELWGGVHPAVKGAHRSAPSAPMFEGGLNLITRSAWVQEDGSTRVETIGRDSDQHPAAPARPSAIRPAGGSGKGH